MIFCWKSKLFSVNVCAMRAPPLLSAFARCVTAPQTQKGSQSNPTAASHSDKQASNVREVHTMRLA